MSWFLIFIPLVVYIILVAWFIHGWMRIHLPNESKTSHLLATVLIACRNETHYIKRLLDCLSQQKTNGSSFEVIIIDDHSDDDTYTMARDYTSTNFNLSVIKANKTGKKAAIHEGIELAKGDVIVCTDADCVIGEHWLNSILLPFSSATIQLVTGPVMFIEKEGFWQQLLQLEFVSLIGIGAASVQNGYPNMCNGANIAYRKSAFYAVDGFAGNEHVPSGDDEFLMHKIHEHFKDGIMFNKKLEAMVYTEPPHTFNEFIQQRIRWGSKAGHYKSFKNKALPLFMYLFNVYLLLSPLLLLLGIPWIIIASLWLGKLGIEIIFFAAVLPFFRSSKLLDLVILAQIFHVIYISVIGILSVTNNYSWKGRYSMII